MFGNDQSDDHKFTEHGYGVITRRTAQPSITLKTGYVPTAFIPTDQSSSAGEGVQVLEANRPITALRSFETGGNQPRAFIPPFVNADGTAHERTEDEPIHTLQGTSYKAMPKAFIMSNANTSSGVMRDSNEPAPTQGNTDRVGNQPRDWLSSGRVVKMTPRALASFQSIPDWYVLPDKARLACTVIGNAVPSLLYQRVIGAQLMQVARP